MKSKHQWVFLSWLGWVILEPRVDWKHPLYLWGRGKVTHYPLQIHFVGLHWVCCCGWLHREEETPCIIRLAWISKTGSTRQVISCKCLVDEFKIRGRKKELSQVLFGTDRKGRGKGITCLFCLWRLAFLLTAPPLKSWRWRLALFLTLGSVSLAMFFVFVKRSANNLTYER